MGSLISTENTWALWAILVGIAALAIWLEQKYSWASKITGCVLALLGMMILANVGVVPTESPVYDSVWSYVVPLAIPLLLFQCNIKKIGKESGRLLIIYLLSSLGTFLGAMGGYFILANHVSELNKVATMFAGTYVGGSVNFAAMADSYGASGELTSAAVVADNLLMALYFFVLIAMPAMAAATTSNMGETSSTLRTNTGRNIITRAFQSTIALFQSLTTAFIISTTTQALMPANAFWTTGYSAKRARNIAITVIITRLGTVEAKPATNPPIVPFLCWPIKVEVFTIIIPGRHCPMA